MSRLVKERRVFSLSNFRGLDTESKPIKVLKNRASEGKNFYSDSLTIKSRPAFKMEKEVPFFPVEGDFVIDWYHYEDVTIYITKKNIYFENGDDVFSVLPSKPKNAIPTLESIPVLIKSLKFTSFDFEGNTPIFQEEKSCLFIFGLSIFPDINGIFVVSFLRDSEEGIIRYVVYDLESKPNNPFSLQNDFFKPFEDLPVPYTPTIIIGDRSFEDVNLLSKKTKYRLFANHANTSEGETLYNLPTHYKPEKNGGFSKTIKFYADKFSQGVFPVFLGIQGENFFSSNIPNDYGTIVNSVAIDTVDVFFPLRDFEYEGTPNSITKIVSEIIELDKVSFFKTRVEGAEGMQVFEFLINHISLNPDIFGSTMTNNLTMKFKINLEYNAVFRDATSQNITEKIKQRKTEDVYIQIKKYELGDFFILSEYTFANSPMNDPSPFEGAWPAYVESPNLDVNFTFEGIIDFVNEINLPEDTLPIYKPGFTPTTFRDMCRTFLSQNKNLVADQDNVKIFGRLYDVFNSTVNVSCDLGNPSNWVFAEWDNTIVWDDYSSITDGNGVVEYPSFTPGSRPVLTKTTNFSTTGENNLFLYQNKLYAQIENSLRSVINGGIDPAIYGEKGTGFYKLKVQTSYTDFWGFPRRKGISIVIPFTYQRTHLDEFQKRQSFTYVCSIDKQAKVLNEDLYSFDYKEDGFFKFVIKDYFYDYNNEPSIDVEVEFDTNPDYLLVANNKFGINFGSENRLFLAGSKAFPNIDRYNVSNDLLGNNVINQSYELSYFPSKNFRVLGGKGAINGYVLATDSHLYVTKANHSNDNVLFVRTRVMNENGIIGYNEFKTSAKTTPLNHKCLVRFNNDILILSKKGLIAIELTSNVLTDERLEKSRDYFVNKKLKKLIENVDESKVFILEDNKKMYIFLEDKVIFLDSALLFENQEGMLNYEFFVWELPEKYIIGKNEDEKIILLDEEGVFYSLEEKNQDDVLTRHEKVLGCLSFNSNMNNYFMIQESLNWIFTSPEKTSFILSDGFKLVGDQNDKLDYHIPNNGVIFVDNFLAFRDVNDGDTLYFKHVSDPIFYPFIVSGFEESNRVFFNFETSTLGERTRIYRNIKNVPLYFSTIFEEPYDSTSLGFRLSPFQKTIENFEKGNGELTEDYKARLLLNFEDNEDYYFSEEGMQDCKINRLEFIVVEWKSSVLDFENNLMEKTMFKANIYATKHDVGNALLFGYKTMRRLKKLENGEEILLPKQVSLANTFDFDEINFNVFSLNTFNDFGMSLPLKENNFLYIQFLIRAQGQIELNSIEIIYKLNRTLKTIG